MEFSFVQTQTFLHFLSSTSILSEKQQASLFEDFSHSSSRKFIFILADFFKKLTPSDSYDLAFRLFTLWEKQRNFQDKANKEKILEIPKKEDSALRKPENYKITIRNHKFSNFLMNFLEKTHRTLIETSFSTIKTTRKSAGFQANYMVHLEDFRALSHEVAEGPRALIVRPEARISPENRRNPTIYEKLYKEANSKKIHAIYLENMKKKKEVQGCTFRPNLLKNSLEKNREKRDFFSLNNNHFVETNQTTSTQNNDLAMRYEKLYSENAIRQLNLIEKQRIEEEKQRKACTFHPKTSKMPKFEKNKENFEFSEKNADFSSRKNAGFSAEKNADFSSQKNADFSSRKNADFSSRKNADFLKEKTRSFSNCEKASRSLEIRDMNVMKPEASLKGLMSNPATITKQRFFQIPEKNAENFRSVYRESDFIAKNL